MKARHRFSLSVPTLVSVMLAILWHAPLLRFRPHDAVPPAVVAASLPTLRYWPVSETADPERPAADVRVIWSPVLFSLPSRVGFGTRPAETVRPQPFDFSTPPCVFTTPPGREEMAGAVALPAYPTPRLLPKPYAPPVFMSNAALRLVVRVDAMDDALRQRLRDVHLDEPNSDIGRPWEAVLWIRFDEMGVPQNIFLDSLIPSDAPPSLGRDILITARRWRLAPGPPIEGRIQLQRTYVPQISTDVTP